MKMIDDDDDKALVFIWVLLSDTLWFSYVFLILSQIYFPSLLIIFSTSETANIKIQYFVLHRFSRIVSFETGLTSPLPLPGDDDYGDGG